MYMEDKRFNKHRRTRRNRIKSKRFKYMLENKYKFSMYRKDLNRIKQNNYKNKPLIDVYLLGQQVKITRENLNK